MGKKILIIEDDTELVARLEKKLINAGYHVDIAPDTLEAYSVLIHDENEAGYHLAIVDLMMDAGFLGREHHEWTEHGGMCILNEIEKEQLDIKLLVYTRDERPEVDKLINDKGIKLFIKNPVTLEVDPLDEIVAEIKEMLNGSSWQKQLYQLYSEVYPLESPLSGGRKLGRAGKTIRSLLETEIFFGNPKTDLIRLTVQEFQEMGIHIDPIIRQHMKAGYKYYYMTMSVSIKVDSGAQFSKIICELDFGPKGENEPIIHTMFPKSVWKEMLGMGVDFNLCLDGDLQWKAVLDSATLKGAEHLPGDIQGKIGSQNNIKAFALGSFRYQFGKAEISSPGEGNSKCSWKVEQPEALRSHNPKFAVVFKVPEAIHTITLTGKVYAETDFGWFTSSLTDVFRHLSDNVKTIFREKRETPVFGDHERWDITLP